MKKIMSILFYLTAIIVAGGIILTPAIAELSRNSSNILSKTTTSEYTLFDANQIASWVGNNGHIVSHNPTSDAGLEWPKGSGNTAVFCSGLWVTGKVGDEIRSAVAEFTTEFLPGVIFYEPHPDSARKAGTPSNPNDARYQIYKINKGDSSDPDSPKYNREYATWPVADGAPAHDGEFFTDLNENGIWDSGEPFEDFNLNGEYDGPNGIIKEGEDPPNLLGDQMLWMVYNDLDDAVHANLFKTKPLGIEVQTTIFGFDRADPLGNVMFVKWLVVNKGGVTIDSCFISMWSDADLGDATDDFVGCDTSLSVGYFYNGNAVDKKYGVAPPSVGYDFFQGPIVPSPGDVALVSGIFIPDYKNLPMTSFVKYTNSDPEYGDPETAEEAFNYMKGRNAYNDPWLMPDGSVTQFLYPGDPQTRSGWTEYDDSSPQDRRFLMSSGPIKLESWVDVNLDGWPQVGEPGVQEIVGAIIIAKGTNNLNAIAAMKFFDQYAQNAYDAQFVLPSPPKPAVLVHELDEQIILSWEDGADIVEKYSFLGYDFEGYNVYQGESPNGPWHLIKTFDKVNEVTIIMDKGLDLATGLILEGPVQFGTDAGIARLIDIRSDKIKGNIDLINNRKYYYAVTAYAYNPDAAPKTVESSKQTIVVRPHQRALGQKLYTATGDYLDVVHNGISEAVIKVNVVDPLQLTGETYAVRFEYDSTAMQGYWYMGTIDPVSADREMIDTLVNNNANLDTFKTDIIDGFELAVKNISFDPPKKFKWEQTTNIIGTQILTDRYDAHIPGAVDSLIYYPAGQFETKAKLDTLYGPGNYYDRFEIVEIGVKTFVDLYKTISHDVWIGGDATTYGGKSAMAASIPGIGGGASDPVLLRSDIEIRFTENGQKASIWPSKTRYKPADSLVTVPFEVWDVERDVQLCVGIADRNNTGGIYGHNDPADQILDNDWVVVLFTDYATTGDSIQTLIGNFNSGWLLNFSEGSKYSVGDVVNLYLINPVIPGDDEYVFVAPALDEDLTKAEKKEQLKLINVFPNPYFAFNIEETQPIQRFVTFTHLPEHDAVIRIFSLAGHLVAKIDHNNSSFSGTSFEQWDLRNKYGIPVASGMYIAHIEIKGVGEKILKIAVFMPEERLDIY